jgi:site-specific DNA-methyltransferase (adenine-specific)
MTIYYEDSSVQLRRGDALTELKELPDQSVHCVVTSPPYWRMRDYGFAEQLGMEDTPEQYVEVMVTLFREVWRVLRDDGTIWVNIGDTFTSGGWGGGSDAMVNRSRTWHQREKLCGWRVPPAGLKRKDLVGIPWRLAFALQEDGWYLRSDIIWEKPNVLPESVFDRPTKSHEYVFLMSKQAQYYYDAEAVKVPVSPNTHNRGTRVRTKVDGAKKRFNRANASFLRNIGGKIKRRNLRDVWTVPNVPFQGNHYSTFPPNLIKPCILAGCPVGGVVLDSFVGTGTTCRVAKDFGRRSIGIDFSAESLDDALERLSQEVLPLEVSDGSV